MNTTKIVISELKNQLYYLTSGAYILVLLMNLNNSYYDYYDYVYYGYVISPDNKLILLLGRYESISTFYYGNFGIRYGILTPINIKINTKETYKGK